MKGYSPFLVAGAACLPITYNITRNGTLLLSTLIVILIAATAYYWGRRLGNPRTAVASAWFVFGTFCSSISFTISRYKSLGDAATKGGSIHEIAALEGIAISVLGVLTIMISAYLVRKYLRPH